MRSKNVTSSSAAAILRLNLQTELRTTATATTFLSSGGVSVTVELVPVSPTLPTPGISSIVIEAVVQLSGLGSHVHR